MPVLRIWRNQCAVSKDTFLAQTLGIFDWEKREKGEINAVLFPLTVRQENTKNTLKLLRLFVNLFKEISSVSKRSN
ncbi:MAG: hypothetical protein BRC46_03800 [Cyanobacteria bacterium QS_6_48_18]|nr:MAG: hypothetical protein BRC46_03800 [Cyanobacteria bacterium QS_6_48_18]